VSQHEGEDSGRQRGPRWGEGRLGEPIEFNIMSGPPHYAYTTERPVRWVEVANESGLLGYLWASDDDAAGWVDRAGAGDLEMNAGVAWSRRLRAAKAKDLSAYQALAELMRDPGGRLIGRAVPGSGGELPSLAALEVLAGRS
jgi:hypothetical protein